MTWLFLRAVQSPNAHEHIRCRAVGCVSLHEKNPNKQITGSLKKPAQQKIFPSPCSSAIIVCCLFAVFVFSKLCQRLSALLLVGCRVCVGRAQVAALTDGMRRDWGFACLEGKLVALSKSNPTCCIILE